MIWTEWMRRWNSIFWLCWREETKRNSQSGPQHITTSLPSVTPSQVTLAAEENTWNEGWRVKKYWDAPFYTPPDLESSCCYGNEQMPCFAFCMTKITRIKASISSEKHESESISLFGLFWLIRNSRGAWIWGNCSWYVKAAKGYSLNTLYREQKFDLHFASFSFLLLHFLLRQW